VFDSDIHIASFVQEKLHEIVSPIKKTSSNWIFRCPVCGDSKKNKRKRRGNYYPKTNSYYCFNEGCSASGLYIISLLGKIPISEVKEEYVRWKRKFMVGFQIGQMGQTVNPLVNPSTVQIPPPESKFELPNEWTDLNEVCNTLIKFRKINQAPYKPKDWKLYYNNKSKRLVLPWIVDGKIKYYQERALYKNQEPKYLFPSNIVKGIFGLDNIDKDCPYIFYTEGCLDSIWSYNTIAIGGTALTDNQRKLLNERYPDKELIWLPDNPWIDISIYNKIIKMKENIKIFKWDENIKAKDINDYVILTGNNNFVNKDYLINNITTSDKMKVMLKLKKLK